MSNAMHLLAFELTISNKILMSWLSMKMCMYFEFHMLYKHSFVA